MSVTQHDAAQSSSSSLLVVESLANAPHVHMVQAREGQEFTVTASSLHPIPVGAKYRTFGHSNKIKRANLARGVWAKKERRDDIEKKAPWVLQLDDKIARCQVAGAHAIQCVETSPGQGVKGRGSIIFAEWNSVNGLGELVRSYIWGKGKAPKDPADREKKAKKHFQTYYQLLEPVDSSDGNDEPQDALAQASQWADSCFSNNEPSDMDTQPGNVSSDTDTQPGHVSSDIDTQPGHGSSDIDTQPHWESPGDISADQSCSLPRAQGDSSEKTAASTEIIDQARAEQPDHDDTLPTGSSQNSLEPRTDNSEEQNSKSCFPPTAAERCTVDHSEERRRENEVSDREKKVREKEKEQQERDAELNNSVRAHAEMVAAWNQERERQDMLFARETADNKRDRERNERDRESNRKDRESNETDRACNERDRESNDRDRASNRRDRESNERERASNQRYRDRECSERDRESNESKSHELEETTRRQVSYSKPREAIRKRSLDDEEECERRAQKRKTVVTGESAACGNVLRSERVMKEAMEKLVMETLMKQGEIREAAMQVLMERDEELREQAKDQVVLKLMNDEGLRRQAFQKLTEDEELKDEARQQLLDDPDVYAEAVSELMGDEDIRDRAVEARLSQDADEVREEAVQRLIADDEEHRVQAREEAVKEMMNDPALQEEAVSRLMEVDEVREQAVDVLVHDDDMREEAREQLLEDPDLLASAAEMLIDNDDV
mmetsp:Transcript_21650/g.42084  ORF Transcript_21650/g.42084 Transcript_21650/m.42084 type:complete len:726 (+) Transcript_21650:152-2329(+)